MLVHLIRHNPVTGKTVERRVIDDSDTLPDWIPYRTDALNDLEAQGWYEGRTEADHRFLLVDLLRLEGDTVAPFNYALGYHDGEQAAAKARLKARDENEPRCQHRDDGRGRCIDCDAFI
jgi:hypothetical protein